jgi:hypothetical protein
LQVTLLGAEEGLYSLHPTTSGYQIVCISGVTKIKNLTLAPHLGIALFISGKPYIRLKKLDIHKIDDVCSAPYVASTNFKS